MMQLNLSDYGTTVVREALELYIDTRAKHFVHLREAGEEAPLADLRVSVQEAVRINDDIRRETEWLARKARLDALQAADLTEAENRLLDGNR